MKNILSSVGFFLVAFYFASHSTDKARHFSQEYQFTIDTIKDATDSFTEHFLTHLAHLFQIDTYIYAKEHSEKSPSYESHIFRAVHIIEPSSPHSKTLASQKKNTTIHSGNSQEILNSLLTKAKNKILLCFDRLSNAQGSKPQSVEIHSNKVVSDDNPLLADLLCIKRSGVTEAIILIDDIHMWDKTSRHLFSGMPSKGPSVNKICTTLHTINKNYRFLIIGDTLLAYPHNDAIKSSPLLQACTISHLYSDTKADTIFLLDSEKIISQAPLWDVTPNGAETKALRSLVYNLSSATSTNHCHLWHALTLMQNGEYLRAYNHLKDMYEKGFNNPRMKLYLAQAAYGASLQTEGNTFTKQNTEYLKNFLTKADQKSKPEAKIALIGAHDKKYDSIGKYAHLNKLEYAKKNHYDVYLYTGHVDPLRSPYWYKITAVQKHLDAYEWIFWLDSDAIIMNHTQTLEALLDNKYDFICFKDCEGSLCSGSFLIKNSAWSKQFLSTWYAQQDVNIQPGFDNGALIKLYNESHDVRTHTKILPQRMLSSYPPPQCSPTGEYRTGDFIIHFAGIKHQDKERLMKEYYNKQL